MAWGIPGNVGDIYAKQQSDELRDQLLKQEMAQRIRAFEAEQVYRQQQMAAQAEERRERAADRQSAREREGRQDTRELARDVLGTSVPGATTEAVAGPLSAYPGTAHLITRRNVLPSTAIGGLSQEDTSGPQNFPVREPTPPELENTRERVRRGELTRVISGVNRADPNWRAKLAAQFADVDPKGALAQVFEPTEAERVAARRGDLEDAARIGAKYRAPREDQIIPVPGTDAQGNPITTYMRESQALGRDFARAVPKKPPTGLQNTALGYYKRMDEAIKTMDEVENKVTDKDILLINNSPLPNLINNPLLSEAGQIYAQALSTYTEARLRKESGAAIAQHEFGQDRQTIGRQVGDTPKTLGKKQQTRRTTARGLAIAAGPAYEQEFGEPLEKLGTGLVATPDLTGLKPGTGRRFNDGPFKGQQWTIGPDGKPKRVE